MIIWLFARKSQMLHFHWISNICWRIYDQVWHSLSTDGTNRLYLEYKIRLLRLFFSALEEWQHFCFEFAVYLSSIYNVWHHKALEVGKLVMLNRIVDRFKKGTHLFLLLFIFLILSFFFFFFLSSPCVGVSILGQCLVSFLLSGAINFPFQHHTHKEFLNSTICHNLCW